MKQKISITIQLIFPWMKQNRVTIKNISTGMKNNRYGFKLIDDKRVPMSSRGMKNDRQQVQLFKK